MQTAKMDSSAAVAAGAMPRARAMATGRDPLCAADGTAEGRGLVSLATWHQDAGATAVALVLRDVPARVDTAAPVVGGGA